jgi:steroid delta-isomerase-like uncharacterized protein
MNEANVEMIRRHFEMENEGRFEDVFAEMSDSPEYFMPGVSDEIISTKDAISNIHRTLFESIADLQTEIVTIYANDEFGFAEIVVRGRIVKDFRGMPGDGKPIKMSTCAVFRFEGGKIKKESIYSDFRELARGLGWAVKLVPAETD